MSVVINASNFHNSLCIVLKMHNLSVVLTKIYDRVRLFNSAYDDC